MNNLNLNMRVLKEDEVRGCAIRLHKVPSSFLSFLLLSLWGRLFTGQLALCVPPFLSSFTPVYAFFYSLLFYLLSTTTFIRSMLLSFAAPSSLPIVFLSALRACHFRREREG
jgi:cellulose synthase/poly-beta-1,6-N-acetylglucosamine synthase-like glycosyltransferase